MSKKSEPGYVNPLKGRKYSPERIEKQRVARMAVVPPEMVRFMSKVFKTEGHWIWTGAHKPRGYGMFCFRGDTNGIAHRASYIMFKGPIPEGLVIDHACGIKSCVHPDHLRAVKQADNCTILSHKPTPFRTNREKTSCKHGHPFTGDNLARVLFKKGRGMDGWSPTRVCLTCFPSAANHSRRFWLPEDLPDAMRDAA